MCAYMEKTIIGQEFLYIFVTRNTVSKNIWTSLM